MDVLTLILSLTFLGISASEIKSSSFYESVYAFEEYHEEDNDLSGFSSSHSYVNNKLPYLLSLSSFY